MWTWRRSAGRVPQGSSTRSTRRRNWARQEARQGLEDGNITAFYAHVAEGVDDESAAELAALAKRTCWRRRRGLGGSRGMGGSRRR